MKNEVPFRGVQGYIILIIEQNEKIGTIAGLPRQAPFLDWEPTAKNSEEITFLYQFEFKI